MTLVIGASERSALPTIRETRTAENRKVAALTQYARSTPSEASSRPATAGPTVQAMFSTVIRSEVACSRSSSVTRFGRPAQTAGRKNPVAIPFTAATATIAVGSSTNGRAANVTANEVRRDHQPLAREAVDQRPHGQPDQDDREEVGDQERGEPAARSRLVVDVHRERERSEIGAHRRAGGRPEEQGEATIPAKEGQTASRSEEHALTLPPAGDVEQWQKTPRHAKRARQSASPAARPADLCARRSGRSGRSPWPCAPRRPWRARAGRYRPRGYPAT